MNNILTTPRIDIDLSKVTQNAAGLKKLYGTKGINILGVTKMVCGDPLIANAILKGGITMLGDSRLANIRKMREAGLDAQYLLLRSPLPSQIDDVVQYADISLNSEISVIQALSLSALQAHTRHKLILMVELGDLREGIMPADLEDMVRSTLDLSGVELIGIGANLACQGGIIPDQNNMNVLTALAEEMEKKFGLALEFISGGNSANYSWFMSIPRAGRVNNLRLGESIYLGCDTVDRMHIPGQHAHAFTLVTEVIESKQKPSLPYGEAGQDAFGNSPQFSDQGPMNRALLGMGQQDVIVSGISPRMDIDVMGSSSDHIVINTKDSGLEVGSLVEFDLDYGALLAAMTSPYVLKNYV